MGLSVSIATGGLFPPTGIGIATGGLYEPAASGQIDLSTLPIWAQGLFTDTCNLYRPSGDTFVTHGLSKVNAGYTLAYSNVPCQFNPTPNPDDTPAGIGRVKEYTILTLDDLWLPEGQEVGDMWAVKKTSVDENGAPKDGYGDVSIIEGDPRRFPSRSPVMQCGHVALNLFTAPGPVTGVA